MIRTWSIEFAGSESPQSPFLNVELRQAGPRHDFAERQHLSDLPHKLARGLMP